MDLKIIAGIVGGLGLFLYGMDLTSKGLQKAAASKMREILSKLTNNQLMGVFVGILITVLLQSSSATTVLLVGFISASMMTLMQAIGVMMGSSIGTTLTVQIIAFKVTDYALILVGIGAAIVLISKRQKQQAIGEAILGFGMIFYGMMVMSATMEPLRSSPGFINLLLHLENPVLGVLVSTVFTAIIQSSAATIALSMSLAMHGVLSLEAAIPIMLGANIGTTATALLSSLTSSRESKRLALAHLIFKLIGALIFLPFLQPFGQFIAGTAQDVGRQIANSHTIFNIINVIVFYPFTKPFADLMTKLLPDKVDERVRPKYLDPTILDVPDLALAHTKNEILRIAKIIQNEMFNKLLELIYHRDEKIAEDFEKNEQAVDILYREINRYLANLAERNLTEDQSEEQVKLLSISNDLEHITDVLEDIAQTTRRMVVENLEICPEGCDDLAQVAMKIEANFQQAVAAVKEDDGETARNVIKGQPEILRLEKNMRFMHFSRLNEKILGSPEKSAVQLDLLNALIRINSHVVSICQAVIGIF